MSNENTFAGLDAAFDSIYTEEDNGSSELVNIAEEELTNSIAERTSQAKDLAKIISSPEAFDDDELLVMRESLMVLLQGNTSMLNRLEKDYNIAPSNKGAEVYSQLSTTQANLVKVFITLNKSYFFV